MSEGSIVIPRSLALTHCPNCGYALAGLPKIGVCPECGRNYGQSEVVLYGYGRGKHENVATAKGSRMFWVVIPWFIWMFYYAFRLRWNSTGLFIVAAIAVVPMMFQFARRHDNAHPGMIQVRLSRNGCVQYDDLTGPAPIHDLWRANSWLIWAAALIGLFIAQQLGWISTGFVMIPTLIIAVIGFFKYRSCARFRLAIRLAPDSAIAERYIALHPVRPWQDIVTFSLVPGKKENYRLSVLARKRFFANDVGDVADAEILCTANQAADILDLAAEWRKETLVKAKSTKEL